MAVASPSLTVGVVGCGAVAQAVHLPLLARLPGVRVIAVADTDPARLTAAARLAPGAVRYADADLLLARGGVDAVVICAPTYIHADVTMAALAHGVHVYVEKPIAATLHDGARVIEAWRRAGVVGMVGFNCRFNPIYERLRALVQAGAAGDVVCVRTAFATAPHDVPEWKRSRATGGGALLDLASHHVDLVRHLLRREVAEVRATVLSRRSDEDTTLLELALDDGTRVQSFFSLAAAAHDQVEVYGERARLRAARFTSLDVDVIENPAGPLVAVRRLARGAASLRHLGGALSARRAPLREPGYKVALARFAAAARAGDPAGLAGPDMADGYACLEVIDAAERSARSGTAVALHPMAPPAAWPLSPAAG